MRDESRSAGFADTISFPKSEKEITDTARTCFESGTMLTVQGGRTGLAAGAVPHGGHVLNLSRMTRILGMRRDGDGAFFVCVEPGVVLAELRKAIESKKIPTSDFCLGGRKNCRRLHGCRQGNA